MKIKELKYTELISNQYKTVDIKSTDEIKIYNGIVGQERALNTVKVAMQIPQKGFNLYVCGQVGMGKTPYVLSIVNELAAHKKVPDDICLVYNFDVPNEPIVIQFEAGLGRIFKEDMNRFIIAFKNDINSAFNSEDFEKQKKVVISKYDIMKNDIMKKFDEYTSKQGFKVRTANDGIYFSPIYNDKVLNEQEFNALDENIRKEFEGKSAQIQKDTLDIMKQIEQLEKECNFKVVEWQNNMVNYIVSKNINDLKIKYKGNLKIQNFLYGVQTDIVSNIEQFKSNGQANMVNSPIKPVKPWEKYKVNLLVNNEKHTHAPVVLSSNPTYFDLFGKLEYENVMGMLKTDHTMLKAGDLLKANGGYLLVNARDLITNMTIWEAFKRVLRNGELVIDSSRDNTQSTIVGLKPEAIKINIQVILFGSEAIYQQLSAVDSDFKKLFKMKADFDDTIEKNVETIARSMEYIAYVVKRENLLSYSKDAILAVLDYSSKCAGDKNKFTAMQVDITDIIIEASFIASQKGNKRVTADDVVDATIAKKKRFAKYDDAIKKMIEQGAVLISTSGSAIGRINGLTIIINGDVAFGKPVRITANTYIGTNGIVNIEREVSLSGTSHSKGVFILSAYIGEKFAQDFPLCFNASICFEQLYNGVDGDSASSTELYAILSSLSDIPIKQGIAVTGSVNQKGEIQPIGGVTDKIEGFFEVCKIQGLTGEQGVIIPHQNVCNLLLSNEVIEAVRTGQFHIYPVSTIDEGIEILTGMPAGTYETGIGYKENTVYYNVYNKLKHYSESSKKNI